MARLRGRLTREHIVLVEQPASYSVGAMLGISTASHGSIQWTPDRGTKVHVLHRESATWTTHLVAPFFFFHVANAFDTADGVAVDVCTFDDAEILTSLRLDRLTDDDLVADLPQSRLSRLTIGPNGCTRAPLDDMSVTGGFADLPTINTAYAGSPDYRYVYAIGARRPTPISNLLAKIDVSGGGGGASFHVDGSLPGEPLFIPRPGGTAEDDGAVLAMSTDDDGGSSLCVLDAADMRLLARCRSPVPLPAGFHATWIADADGQL